MIPYVPISLSFYFIFVVLYILVYINYTLVTYEIVNVGLCVYNHIYGTSVC